jgi:hypothetical protein
MPILDSKLSPESVPLPKKQFLTDHQFVEVWDIRGLKYRVDEFHRFCLDRGLLAHVRKDEFRDKIYTILKQFFVDGESRRDPRYVPRKLPRKAF